MNDHLDPEKLKIPAYLRKKAIVRQSKQKLILTALDRKQAGLDVHSQRALAPVKSLRYVKEKSTAKTFKQPIIKKSKATSFPNQTKYSASIQTTFPSKIQSPQRKFLRSLFPSDDGVEDQPPKHEAPQGFVEIMPIGHITAYFEKIQVAVIKLEKPLRIGDLIQITGENMLFQQPVDSMQINRKPVKIAKKGSEIGLKVSKEPKLGGQVYKVSI